MEQSSFIHHIESAAASHKETRRMLVFIIIAAIVLVAYHGMVFYNIMRPNVGSATIAPDTRGREKLNTIFAEYKARQARELTAGTLKPSVIDPSK